MKRFLLLSLFSAALLTLCWPCSGEAVTDGDLRILRVRAVADEEFRERDDWRAVVGEYLAFASNFYEKTFDIRFDLAKAVAWESDDRATLSELVDRMEDEISFNGVDVVIGFSGQRPNRGKLSKYVPLPWGLTPGLGRVSMIRARTGDASYDLHLALVHEIAHLFGAFHVADPNFVMRETVDGPRTFQFDVENGKVLRLMKGYDFQEGIAAIPPEVRDRITDLWRRGGVPGDNNPVAEALFNLGVDLHEAGDMPAALKSWREATQYDDTFAAPHGLLGVALATEGDYAAALEELRIAAQLGWPQARQVMQRVLHQQSTQSGGE